MSKHQLFNFSLFITYILAATAFMIWQGIGIAPDRYGFLLIFPALVIRKTRAFFFDWIPFLFILISYDFLRGFADNLNMRVHFYEPIQIDKLLFFGGEPIAFLQRVFYNSQHLGFFDYLATIFYFLHFALPLAFGFLIWMKSKQSLISRKLENKPQFKEFVTAILILSYLAWATYLVFPVAPPWMAAQQGYLPGVSKILDQTLKVFPDKYNLPTVYHNINPNPVAALPSLHAAYPFLVLLFCLRFFKKKGWYFMPYVIGVWLSVIYLGEHYVIDVIAGALYAFLSYLIAIRLLHNAKFHKWLERTLKLPGIKSRQLTSKS